MPPPLTRCQRGKCMLSSGAEAEFLFEGVYTGTRW
jgi:hypothetical protein